MTTKSLRDRALLAHQQHEEVAAAKMALSRLEYAAKCREAIPRWQRVFPELEVVGGNKVRLCDQVFSVHPDELIADLRAIDDDDMKSALSNRWSAFSLTTAYDTHVQDLRTLGAFLAWKRDKLAEFKEDRLNACPHEGTPARSPHLVSTLS